MSNAWEAIVLGIEVDETTARAREDLKGGGPAICRARHCIALFFKEGAQCLMGHELMLAKFGVLPNLRVVSMEIRP
jgi:hypothetical protein